MILKGSQRAGGEQLARHLLNDRDNDHVTIHHLRGFISDDLGEAFTEAYAVSQATKCKQFLFSLSLNPPETEKVPVEIFEAAIAKIEDKLGLQSQPRAIVFHEKEGRRHAHCIWSRIDVTAMKAINLPHYKMKLQDIARDLYFEHEWEIPNGFLNKEERNPLNFTLAEWQQAKRTNQDPRIVKALIQKCWTISDSSQSFANALTERGFYLAQGDRRGHVVVDRRGEVFSLSRLTGIKTKIVAAKLGSPKDLPTVGEIQKQLGEKISDEFREFVDLEERSQAKSKSALDIKRRLLVNGFRAERQRLRSQHSERQTKETTARSHRLPIGLKALWFRVTGKYSALQKQNETESKSCKLRDQSEMQNLIERQLIERRQLQHEYQVLRNHQAIKGAKLDREIGDVLSGFHPSMAESMKQRLECSNIGQRRKPSHKHE